MTHRFAHLALPLAQHIGAPATPLVSPGDPVTRGQRIARCTSCKVALWSNYLANNQGEQVRFLRVGTLDDPTLMPPDLHIFTATKQPWYVIPEGVTAFENFYHRKRTWPKASYDRLVAVSEKTGAALP